MASSTPAAVPASASFASALHTLNVHTDTLSSLCSLSNGRLLAGVKHSAVLVDTKAGTRLGSVGYFGGTTYSVCALSGTSLVAIGNNDCVVIVDYDTKMHQTVKSVFEGQGYYGPGHSYCVYSLCALPDGRVVSGGGDHGIFVWEVGTKTPLVRMYSGAIDTLSLCTLDDGRVASSHNDGGIGLWDIAAGKRAGSMGAQDEVKVNSLCVLPGGRIASASEDGTVSIWNLRTATCEESFKGHTGSANCVIQWSGAQVLSCGDDGLVKLWDLARSAPESKYIAEVQGYTGYGVGKERAVASLCALSPDTFASGTVDGIVKIWSLGA